jgi:uncharacterized iron-regulated membrane protein
LNNQYCILKEISVLLDQLRTIKLRPLIFQIHSWIGLIVGILIAIIGLTGSGIVFMHELDHTLNPALMNVEALGKPQSIDLNIAPVIRSHPNLAVESIQLPKTNTDPVMVVMKTAQDERLETYVNPYTSQILGERIWEKSIVGFMHTLHYTLFAGKIGQIAVGVEGLLFLFVSLTGILLWTGWQRLKNGFRIRWNSPKFLNFDLHNMFGVFSGLFLMLLAITGTLIVVVHLALTPPTLATPAKIQPIAQLASVLQAADRALPEGKISSVEFSSDGETISLRKKLPDQKTGIFDLSMVEVDRATGKVISANKVIEPPPIFKVILTIVDLHYGTFGGLTTQILYVVIGLMPTMLIVTGFSLWQRRRLIKSL